MCGISGIYGSSAIKSEAVAQSIRAMSHRGPDDTGFYESEYCVLGMCRLSIIDIEHGKQPSTTAASEITSVFNGELYNFRELKKLVLGQGFRIEANGDSALIPYLYLIFGPDFVKHLEGMFAIALFDSRSKDLYLVRDRLGEKPLWYYQDKGTLYFASEIKGLLSLGIPKIFDTSNLSEYLQFGYINAPRSPFIGVRQLEPATILRFNRNEMQKNAYWSINDAKSIDISFAEAKNEVTRLLRHSVKTRMISERPVGAFLSGGIDSTVISALMTEFAEKSVHTFSIGFNDRRSDESGFARKVANYLGTTHHELILDPNPSLIINEIAQTLDQPFADSSIIPTFVLSRFARKEVVVALSGDGGDEVFGGYERYRATRALKKLNHLLIFNPTSGFPSKKISNQKVQKLFRHSRPSSFANRYRNFQSLLLEDDLERLLNSEIILQNIYDPFSELWQSIPIQEEIRKMQEVDLKSYLPGDILFKVDIASMANSLEVRSPFLDHQVVEFGLKLPAKLKFARMKNKFLLRELARDLVPYSLIDRPKKGFGIPRARWLREDLDDLVRDTLLTSTFQDRGWFNYEELVNVIDQHKRGFNLDSIIWPIFMLELWARNWLDS